MDTNQNPDDINLDPYLGGAFIRKDDVRDKGPIRVTIANVETVTFPGRRGEPAQNRLVLTFVDPPKKLSLNKTNLKLLKNGWGDRTSTWKGRVLRIEFDPNVVFGTETVGGLRLRLPRLVAPPPPPAPVNDDEFDTGPNPF